MTKNVYQDYFKKTLAIGGGIVALLMILLAVYYLFYYYLNRGPQQLKPSKKVFSQNDSINYGYESIKILESKIVDDSGICFKEEDNPNYPTHCGSLGIFERIERPECSSKDRYVRVGREAFGVKVFFSNSFNNRNRINYGAGQFRLVKKESFDLNNNSIKATDDPVREYLYSCDNALKGGQLLSGETDSGWIYFRRGKDENLNEFYLIANLFPGSPSLVIDLDEIPN